jgi:hypothetical protein
LQFGVDLGRTAFRPQTSAIVLQMSMNCLHTRGAGL